MPRETVCKLFDKILLILFPKLSKLSKFLNIVFFVKNNYDVQDMLTFPVNCVYYVYKPNKPVKLFRKTAHAYRRTNSLRCSVMQNKTEKLRTLWRTHSVVCRRCKAKAESLRQTDREAEKSVVSCYA